MWNKVNFFLNKFPSTEWSGPAWYKPHYKKGEKYPVGFTLVHFHPVDLGHATATTIEAEDTAKILQKTWKKYPETEKCMMGIIHSHHTMGAYFSGTDINCLEDNAPEKNFYCSTVVASKKDKFAFAISYQDQYGQVHVHEAKPENVKLIMPEDKTHVKEWVYIADKIKKKKEETTIVGHYNGRGRLQQGSLWPNSYYDKVSIEDTQPDAKKIDEIGTIADASDDPESMFLQLLMEAWEKKEIEYGTMVTELNLLGIDPMIFMNEYNKKGRNDVIALPKTTA